MNLPKELELQIEREADAHAESVILHTIYDLDRFKHRIKHRRNGYIEGATRYAQKGIEDHSHMKTVVDELRLKNAKLEEMLKVAEEALEFIARNHANTGSWDTDCEAYEEYAYHTLTKLKEMREWQK